MGSKTPLPENPYVVFLRLAIKSFVFTLIWIPIYIVRCLLVKFSAKYKKRYGKILDFQDATLEENFSEEPPKNTIAFTFILDGDLKLKDLQQLFTRNVLEARISRKDSKTNETEDKLRYPEYRQYINDFAGFSFWKDDAAFSIGNHITEQTYQDGVPIAKIHQEMINKTFPGKKSPWEIILIRNYENSNKTLLVYRSHHTLGDTKSLLKVFVECLGQKALKLPKVEYKSMNILHKFWYYVLMPFYFVFVQVRGHFVALKANDHPWKFKSEKETLLNIGISQKVSMNDVKAIAKKNNVTTSAVIMSAIAGGAANSDPRLRQSGIPCQYVLPKENHPDTLCNYSYSAVMSLPTNFQSPQDLLKKCNEIFVHMKTSPSELHKYDKLVTFQLGTWFNPLRTKFLRNTTFPLIITNVAGDTEGFEIGENDVSELTMTCAPCPGAAGVIICAFSYKDVIEVSVTAKEGILSEAESQKLADLMGKEFQVLKNM